MLEQVGFLGYPLLLCSLVAIWVILIKALFWVQYYRGLNSVAVKACFQALCAGDKQAVLAQAKTQSHPMLRIVHAGVSTLDATNKESALQYACACELRPMRAYYNALVFIISVAPMLGILGTIIGIIQAFNSMNTSGAFEPVQMISGISMALWTTAIGLSVTIMTLLPYYFFLSQTAKAGHAFEDWATKVAGLE